MLRRNLMRSRLAALVASLFLAAPFARAAPADELRDAQKLYTQGRLPTALEKVDGYLKGLPRDPQGRFLRGLILTEQKRTGEAIQVFTGLTEDFPELPEPYNNLAVLFASQGNYDKAKSSLELAIHTHPTYATAHENLGDIYAQLASRAYDRALALDKSNTTAQVKLSMVKDLFTSQKVAAAKPPDQKPPAASDAQAQIAATIDAWAKAWSAKDAKGYLAFYAPDFETPAGEARAAWEKSRTERIERPKSIEVDVKMQSIKVSGNEATAVFRQTYKSDTLKSGNTKTLKLLKVGERWLIKQERAGG